MIPSLVPPQAGVSSNTECSSPSLKAPGVGLSSDDQHSFPGSIQELAWGWSWCHPCSATPVRGLSYTSPGCFVLAGWGQGTAAAEPQEKPFLQFRWKPETSLLAAGRQQEEGTDKIKPWPIGASVRNVCHPRFIPFHLPLVGRVMGSPLVSWTSQLLTHLQDVIHPLLSNT